MRRRITTAIVGVTTFVLLALGIPLAVVVQRQILDSEVVELQAKAAETLTEIVTPLDLHDLTEIAGEPDPPPPFSVYDTDGALFFGDGPNTAEPTVEAALTGITSSSTDGQIVVATPITDRDEVVVGALRLGEPLTGASDRTRRAWLVMGLAGSAAIGVAWLIASRLARRLSRPVTDLAEAAARFGHGSVLEQHPPSGIGEIDVLGEALVDGSRRASEALARERRFSADVSHQLRTPLAGLRLKLEAAGSTEDGPAIVHSALVDVDRIEATVAHLLAFARDAAPPTEESSLLEIARHTGARWDARATALSRTVSIGEANEITVPASPAAIDQILDVLVDNALTHGRGKVRLDVRRIAGGASIDVVDEGSLADGSTEAELFRRGHGANNGIGLALARSIAEAEGARLVIGRRHPTTFSLVLVQTIV